MDEDYSCWDDGATDIILVSSLSAQIKTLASGPLVLAGWALWNAGGAACNTRFSDGAAGQFYQTSIGTTNKDSNPPGFGGIMIETELVINVVGAGPVSGAVFVRRRDSRRKKDRESQPTSTPTLPSYPPEPSQQRPPS